MAQIQFKIKKDGNLVETNTLLLIFDRVNVPKSLKIFYRVVPVDVYIPNPLRCFNCQRFGHHENNCTEDSGSVCESRNENPQKLTQLSSRSHPRHLVGKRKAQKDITIDTRSDRQVNSNFPNRWSPASLTFNNYFYLLLYLYIT